MKPLSPTSPEHQVIEFPPLNETQRILKQALMRLGDGRAWGQNALVSDGRYCALGALIAEAGFGSDAYTFLSAAADEKGASVVDLNNAAKSFSEVRSMFERAIHLASTK